MKNSKKHPFSLIELMFVITVLVILISISWVGGRKVFQEQVKRQTQSEIVTLDKVIEVYKIRYGSYPAHDTSTTPPTLNFGEKLSDTKPGSGLLTKRVMYIDYRKQGFKVSNSDYDDPNATAATVLDPRELPYLYYHDSANNRYFIWSVGADGIDDSSDDYIGAGDGFFGDDISNVKLQN